jgi:hypothetical protein
MNLRWTPDGAPLSRGVAHEFGFAFLVALVVTTLKWLIRSRLYPPESLASDPWGFGYEQGQVAARLALGHGFTEAGPQGPVPTAWFSPLYPLLLVEIFRVWGLFTVAAATAVIVLNCVFQGLAAGLMYIIGSRVGGRSVGLVWPAIFLLDPNGWQFLGWAWHTQLYALAILLHLGVLILDPRRPLVLGALAGATLAIALLVDGAAITILPVTVVHLGLRGRTRGWSALVAAILVGGLCMTPWTLHNYRASGTLNPLRGNAGVNLWVGNHPQNRDESYHGWALSAWGNMEERRHRLQMGEPAYDRHCRARAVEQIRADPLRFVVDTWRRTTGFWLGEWWVGFRHIAWIHSAGLALMSCLVLVGIWRGRRACTGMLMPVTLLFPVPYYLTVHGHGRYRAPIEPVLCILAALALVGAKARAVHETQGP